VDTGSKYPLTQAVESAQRSDTLVYSILFADPDAYGSGGMPGGFGGRRRGMGMPPGRGMGSGVDGKKVLQSIATETGGRFFEVSKRMPIDKVYEAIQEDLRSQYSIGYTPEGAPNSSEYRRIHLSTKRKDLVVQTREGYYPS
jgi:VWFA-related protein